MPAWGGGSTAPCSCAIEGRERHHPSSLAFWVSAHPRGTWKQLVNCGAWRRVAEGLLVARDQPGFCRPSRGSEPRASGAARSVCWTPQPPVRAVGTTAAVVQPQPCSWALPGSSPHRHNCVPPANAAHRLAAKVSRGGRGRYPKVFSPTSLGSYLSAWSVAGCPSGDGGCWQWDKTGMLPLEERNWGFQTHFSQCWAAEAFRHPATNLQSASLLVFYFFRLPLKDLPKVRKHR